MFMTVITKTYTMMTTKEDEKMIYENVTELIGETPLVRLNRIEQTHQLNAKLIIKLESKNPSGSVKDRIALAMVEEAERKKVLKEGTVIIEPTSGNTGIGLASIAASKGYRLILTMSEAMSVERRNLLKAYGAEIVLTPASAGMKGAINRAHELASEIENSIILGQFTNPANPAYHEKTTGPEIWRDTDGKIDIFVAGIGTGGTITGAGRFLKSKNPGIKIIGVEPAGSPFLSEGRAGPHNIQGIGAGFKPDTLDIDVIGEIVTVIENDAYAFGREIARKEGILVGISSGAALSAAVKIAKRPENHGKTIVTLLADTGERYLSTPMFTE
jgi:cysteine synthase A